MSRCVKCGVEILDQSERCPLCQHVLEHGGMEQIPAYPDVRQTVRRFRFLENLILFLSIMIETLLIYLNLRIHPQLLWSVMAGLGLIYGNVVLRLAVLGKSGYIYKTVILVIMAILMLLGIDYLSGYRRWSLNYVLPCGIILMDIAVIVMMIINNRNWQSYMMMEIFMVLCSVATVILSVVGVVTVQLFAIIALGCSVFLFLGTLILGDRRAQEELKRRFHL